MQIEGGCGGARTWSPLQVSDLYWSRDLHPVSGLFGSRVATSLPRFTATSRARPGLTVGSTLDGGPDWADDARCFLVACGFTAALHHAGRRLNSRRIAIVPSQPMSCTCPQAWQVFDDGNHRSATTNADPYQRVL